MTQSLPTWSLQSSLVKSINQIYSKGNVHDALRVCNWGAELAQKAKRLPWESDTWNLINEWEFSGGKGTLAFRSYQAAGRACSRRRHGSFEQVKEVHCSWNRGKREGDRNRSRKRRRNEAWKSFIGPRIKILVLNLKSVQRDEGLCLYKDKKPWL